MQLTNDVIDIIYKFFYHITNRLKIIVYYRFIWLISIISTLIITYIKIIVNLL